MQEYLQAYLSFVVIDSSRAVAKNHQQLEAQMCIELLTESLAVYFEV